MEIWYEAEGGAEGIDVLGEVKSPVWALERLGEEGQSAYIFDARGDAIAIGGRIGAVIRCEDALA